MFLNQRSYLKIAVNFCFTMLFYITLLNLFFVHERTCFIKDVNKCQLLHKNILMKICYVNNMKHLMTFEIICAKSKSQINLLLYIIYILLQNSHQWS